MRLLPVNVLAGNLVVLTVQAPDPEGVATWLVGKFSAVALSSRSPGNPRQTKPNYWAT